jgi:hypothetical protein
MRAAGAGSKSLLVLFFRKELLTYFFYLEDEA